MIYRDQDEAENSIKEWQERLLLQDWDLKIKIVRQSKLPPDAMAHVSCVFQSKQALIRLTDPIDYPKDAAWLQDHEQSLVHELLHLHCWGFADDDTESPKGIAEEQTASTLARALVKFKRDMFQMVGIVS